MTEYLTGVAIMWQGRMFSLPKPNRHWNVFRMIRKEVGEDTEVLGDTQGFVTNKGRFVDREEAMHIAMAREQIIKYPTFQPRQLFSEDLW